MDIPRFIQLFEEEPHGGGLRIGRPRQSAAGVHRAASASIPARTAAPAAGNRQAGQHAGESIRYIADSNVLSAPRFAQKVAERLRSRKLPASGEARWPSSARVRPASTAVLLSRRCSAMRWWCTSRNPEAGGMLRLCATRSTACPEVGDRPSEVAFIRIAWGCSFQFNTRIGVRQVARAIWKPRNTTAVFLALGTWEPVPRFDVPRRATCKGVLQRRSHFLEARRCTAKPCQDRQAGWSWSAAAMPRSTAARTVLRMGCEASRSSIAASGRDMPATTEAVEAAEEEGVQASCSWLAAAPDRRRRQAAPSSRDRSGRGDRGSASSASPAGAGRSSTGDRAVRHAMRQRHPGGRRRRGRLGVLGRHQSRAEPRRTTAWLEVDRYTLRNEHAARTSSPAATWSPGPRNVSNAMGFKASMPPADDRHVTADGRDAASTSCSS